LSLISRRSFYGSNGQQIGANPTSPPATARALPPCKTVTLHPPPPAPPSHAAGKDKKLGFDPLCVSFFQNGEFLLVSGSNRKTTL